MSTKFLENTTCPICHLNSNMTLTLPCGHKQICHNCLCHWISIKIASIHSKIPCPVETCKKEFTLQEIISTLPEPEKAKIKEFLSSDIKPNILQKYPNNADLVIHEEDKGFFKKIFDKLRNCKNELFIFFWKIFKTKKCPGCKVRIPIVGDDYECQSMQCPHCQCQFCWHCLKEDCQKSHGYGELTQCDVVEIMLVVVTLGLVLGLGALWGLKLIGSWVISGIASFLA